MLVLNQKDVQYCQLIDRQYSPSTIYSVIRYRGFIFVKIGDFSYNHIATVQGRCRQFLELNKPITALIVKEIERITLWIEICDFNPNHLHFLLPVQPNVSVAKTSFSIFENIC